MASSGTVADPIVDVRLRPQGGHDTTLIMGRVRVKSTAVIEAGDLTLRTIKNAVITPYRTQDRAGAQGVPYGSVTLSGSLMNAVSIQIVKGTLKQANVPAIGTAHIGTVVGGTMQVGFFITGA